MAEKRIVSDDSGKISFGKGIISKVYLTGNLAEVITVQKRTNNLKGLVRQDRDHYLNLSTGEIKEYRHTQQKCSNPDNLRKSLENLRRTINANFCGDDCERHIVLTYGELMTDTDKLYGDMNHFVANLRRYYHFEYIAIVEPHADGRWHVHLLVKQSNDGDFYIPQSRVQHFWKHGGANIRKLPVCDNYGAYFSAHVTNLDTSENPGGSISKRTIKGARLKFYPTGMKIYRCSKGIVRSQAIQMKREEALEALSDTNLLYSSTKVIYEKVDHGEEKQVNAVLYERFAKQLKEESR